MIRPFCAVTGKPSGTDPKIGLACGCPSCKRWLNTNRWPRWVACPSCDDFWCLLHHQHAYDCECPPVDELDFDPYSEWGAALPSERSD